MKHTTMTHDSLASSRSMDTTTRFHQVLIILFSAFFFGGSSSNPLPDRIDDAVSDSARSARAVAIAKRVESRREALLRETLTWHDGFYKTLHNHKSAEPDIFGQLQSLISSIEVAEDELLDLRFELRDELTADEWKGIWD